MLKVVLAVITAGWIAWLMVAPTQRTESRTFCDGKVYCRYA
jgi:hypothetical protein